MSRDKITGVGDISIATHSTRRLSFCFFLFLSSKLFQRQLRPAMSSIRPSTGVRGNNENGRAVWSTGGNDGGALERGRVIRVVDTTTVGGGVMLTGRRADGDWRSRCTSSSVYHAARPSQAAVASVRQIKTRIDFLRTRIKEKCSFLFYIKHPIRYGLHRGLDNRIVPLISN